MFHLTQTKQGIFALELSRRIGVTYNTAWEIRSQAQAGDAEARVQQAARRRVEMDDAYLGGERSGGTRVVTGGLGCFRGVADAGCMHEAIVTGSGGKAARHPSFRAIDTAHGNIKTGIVATFHASALKHAPRRLAEFAWRFDRRYDLPAIIPRLGWVAAQTPPMPYHLLKMAEVCG